MYTTVPPALESGVERRFVPLTKAAFAIQDACPDQSLPSGVYNLLKRLAYDGRIRVTKVGRELCLDMADVPVVCRTLGLVPSTDSAELADQTPPDIAA